MGAWIFEPGHTAAEFRARHMMVTWVRGLFKDIRGTVEWDLAEPENTTFSGRIDTTRLWTGEPERDAHLRSADFFDVENHRVISFEGRFSERVGELQFKALRTSRSAAPHPRCRSMSPTLGQWKTPFWVEGENRGTMRRIGFEAPVASIATPLASPGRTSCPAVGSSSPTRST